MKYKENSVFPYLNRLPDVVLDLAQTDLFVADSHAHNQDADGSDYLSDRNFLAKNEDIWEHGVDDVDETNEWDKASITTLESNCLAHDTDGVETCRSK